MEVSIETTRNESILIGIISDNHGGVPNPVFDIFKNVNIIIHAGDFGNMDVVAELEAIAPLYGVSGNIDLWEMNAKFPQKRQFEISGIKFYVQHNIKDPVKHYLNLKRDSLFSDTNIVIYGHTHVPDIKKYGNYLYVNPGSTVQPRKGHKPSVCLLEIENGEYSNPQIVYFD